MRFSLRSTRTLAIALCLLLLVGGAVVAWLRWGTGQSAAATYKTPAEANVYVRFEMEAYDIIAANYWIHTGSYANFNNTPELPTLFQLAAQRVTGLSSVTLASSTRDGTAAMLGTVFSAATSTAAKQQEAAQMLSLVLTTLPPGGHNGLLSSAAQKQLQNTVNNVKPADDLYADLGLPHSASASDVPKALAQKVTALAATTSDTGKAALADAKHAAQVLTNTIDKTIYDQTSAQPTVFEKKMGAHTLYLHISSVAPTTIYEIASALQAASSTPALNSLIIDVRGNIGGDLDFAQQFLGLFYGAGSYGFDLYHQGDLTVQRTIGAALPALSQFKEIAVLTDGMTQSTAEVVSSALKHNRLAIVVGNTSRGWGSVEHPYTLSTVIDPSETYAVLLVTYLTVRYDGNPIEGNGVVPDVDISQAGWQSKLPHYFSSPDLISAVQTAVSQPPLQQ